MNFRKDKSRIRKKQSPAAFNIMIKITMVLLKLNTTKSVSMAKNRMVGLVDDYLLTLLLESEIKMR
jgi:hypothetical protein